MKGKGERYTQLKVGFQRITRRDEAFLNEQHKEIEENSRIGKTRDIFTKTGVIKGIFHARMGMIKDRISNDLTEAEVIKKRRHEYTEKLYKKKDLTWIITIVWVTHLKPGILECEVKRALGSIAIKIASRGNGIQMCHLKLKKDVVKVLHSIYQQIWKSQQWPQDWKGQVSFQTQRRVMPNNYQTTVQLCSFHMLTMLCSKPFKLGFNST